MHHTQAAPIRQLLVTREGLIDGNSPVTEEPPPDRFQKSAEATRAGVGESAVDMTLFGGMREDRRARKLLEPGEIAGVIEVAVGEENRLDILPAQADLAQHVLQPGDFADESGIEQHGLAPGAVVEEMERAVIAADGIKAERIIQGNIV